MLNDRAKTIYNYIRSRIDDGYAPTVREICHALDVSRPVIIPRHERDWENFGLTTFLPEHFVESVSFDKMELQYIDPDRKKQKSLYSDL